MMEYDVLKKGRHGFVVPVPTGYLARELEKELSYVRKNSQFLPRPEWGRVCLYDVKKGRFPIGLKERILHLIDIPVNIIVENDYKLFSNLRHYQELAINLMIKENCGIIKMPTGSGKTRVAVEYIKHVNKPTLVLVPTLDLVRQWKSQVPDYVHVKTYAGVKKKSYVQQFGVVIFDECHHVAAKTLYRIGMNVAENTLIFGFSATPLERDDDNLKVEAVLGPIIYEVPLQDMINQGFLCDAEVHYHKVEKQDYSFMIYPEVYKDYIVNNIDRNDNIAKLACNCEKPCLILVNLIDHGEFLLTLLNILNQDVVFLNGQMKKDERANTCHDIIIATSIYDEGVDIPELKTLIIAAGGKSSIKTCQRIGRILRPLDGKDLAIVHDFKDNAKWLKKHYLARRHIFEKNFKVIDDD